MWNEQVEAGAAAGFRARRSARRQAQFGRDAARRYGYANSGESEDEFGWIPGFDRLKAAVTAIPSYLGVTVTAPTPVATPAPSPVAPVPVPTVPPTAAASANLKDQPNLRTVALAPAAPVAIDPGWSRTLKGIAQTYNRLGGLMQAVATQLGVDVKAVLAIWKVESGSAGHVPGQAIIRFENHLLYRRWGKSAGSVYDQYFRHGGHAGVSGQSWENHQYRETTSEPFRMLHTGKQEDEYRALRVATRIAGETHAIQCISIGGPQILVSNYSLLGYATPRAMYDAFQGDERYHVLGFFDFCRNQKAPAAGDLVKYLRARNWSEFARYYNGPGQVDTYGKSIGDAFAEARKLPISAREFELPEDAAPIAYDTSAPGHEPTAEPEPATEPPDVSVSDAALHDLLRHLRVENQWLRARLNDRMLLPTLRRDVRRLARRARPVGMLRHRRTGRRLPLYQARAGRRTFNIVARSRRGGQREIVLVAPTADA